MSFIKVKKMRFVKKEKEKMWFHIDFTNNYTWSPSLKDLFKIIVGIFIAEDKNYPPSKGYKGAEMTIEAINEVLSYVRTSGLNGLKEYIETIEHKFDPKGKYKEFEITDEQMKEIDNV